MSVTASSSRCGPTTNLCPPERSHPSTTPRRSCGCMPACESSISRRRTSPIESPRHSNWWRAATTRRRSPMPIGSSQDHVARPDTSDRRPRRRRAVAARRTAPGQSAQYEEWSAVHRPGDGLPWACRIRPRPCSRSCQRTLSGRRSQPAPSLPGSRSCHGRRLALGSARPVPGQTTSGHRTPQRATQRSTMAGEAGLYPRIVELVEILRRKHEPDANRVLVAQFLHDAERRRASCPFVNAGKAFGGVLTEAV